MTRQRLLVAIFNLKKKKQQQQQQQRQQQPEHRLCARILHVVDVVDEKVMGKRGRLEGHQ